MLRKVWSRDLGVGVVSAILGIGFIISAMQITQDPSAFDVLGPRVAPLTIGVVTVFVSVLLIIRSLQSADTADSSTEVVGEPSEDSGGERSTTALLEEAETEQRSVGRVLVSFALLLGYALVFIPLGYVVSTALFLLAMTTYADRRMWLRNAIFAVVFAVVVYFVFTKGLQVQLPAGILG